MYRKLIYITVLLLIGCVPLLPTRSYDYEVCDNFNNCPRFSINRVNPSLATFDVCNDQGKCEKVPINRLLLKGGTDKKYCNKSPYLESDYVDNWWNADGLIDECEIPPKANMQFIFKQHNQTTYSHTGTIQIAIKAINYNNNYLALQIFTGEDNNKDELPDSWVYCGNVDKIKGIDDKVIQCDGNNLKFVKIVNAEWNPTSIFIDWIEVLRA